MLTVDPLPALISFLQKGLGRDVKVYGGRIDSFFNRKMPAPCVVLNTSGLGSGEGHAEESSYGSQRIDCMAYDGTEARSAALSLSAHNQLIRVSREIGLTVDDATTKILSIVLTAGPVSIVENQTDWYGILRTYNVLAHGK